jgi:sporulation protein YlmC with PRC-barrel domain
MPLLNRNREAFAAAFVMCLLWPVLAGIAQNSQPTLTTRTYGSTEAGTILGRSVIDTEGTDVGSLVDIVVDKTGKPVAGVIDVGGFLGVGTRRIAVAWSLLRFVHDSGETIVHMNLTLDSAAAAPESQGPDNSLIVIDRPPQ